jgi:acetate kinase
MNILVLNCGSSSVKFQLIDTDTGSIANNTDRVYASGMIERIGTAATLNLKAYSPTGEMTHSKRSAQPIRSHREAVDYIIKWIINPDHHVAGIHGIQDIHAVGHRVVHGGESLTASTLIDKQILSKIEDYIDLAPLHNPQNLKGIYAAREALGANLPQVAVFDTAFHHTLPEYAYLYAIPYQYYRRHKIRRYGFHGLSHRYVGYRYRTLTGCEREAVNIISLHLGNGCSACAIKNGYSADTTMGMTPLEGLIMGTRAGDIDPGVINYLAHKEGLSIDEIDAMLNKQSGLLGISGLTNDMRDLVAEAGENDDRRAKLAIDMFAYRIKKYIGAYLTMLNGATALVFTGGIGENAALIREKVCSDMEWCGLHVDASANMALVGGKEGKFSTDESRLEAWVIPTNEELLIARDTYRCVNNEPTIM